MIWKVPSIWSMHRAEPDRGGEPGRGDQVVAAAVADPRQRVVLGEDGDRRPRPLARASSPGRPFPAHRAASRPRSPLAQRVRQQLRGEALLIADLRPLVDLVGHIDDPRPVLVNRPGDLFSQIFTPAHRVLLVGDTEVRSTRYDGRC